MGTEENKQENLEQKVGILGRLKRAIVPLSATIYEGLKPEIDNYLKEKTKNGEKYSKVTEKVVGAGAVIYGAEKFTK